MFGRDTPSRSVGRVDALATRAAAVSVVEPLVAVSVGTFGRRQPHAAGAGPLSRSVASANTLAGMPSLGYLPQALGVGLTSLQLGAAAGGTLAGTVVDTGARPCIVGLPLVLGLIPPDSGSLLSGLVVGLQKAVAVLLVLGPSWPQVVVG